jgi:hypothetical protein
VWVYELSREAVNRQVNKNINILNRQDITNFKIKIEK